MTSRARVISPAVVNAIGARGSNGVVAAFAPLWPILRDVVRRRAVEVLVFVIGVLAASPATRHSMVMWLRAALRSGFGLTVVADFISGFGRPKVRKDFLSGSSNQLPASAEWSERRSTWKTSSSRSCTNQRSANSDPSADPGALFSDFATAMPNWLEEALRREGYDRMKPIQSSVLPLALRGRDVVGIAPTGSGKTLAFLVPAIVHINGQTPPRRIADGPIALVLAPTRELVLQIEGVARGLWAGGSRGRSTASNGSFRSLALYGGTRRMDQLQALRQQQQTHMFVATPGRLLDFLQTGAFGLRLVSFFVLDEGDRMLDFGFQEDIQAISALIRRDRQMLFFSATWPREVEQAAAKLCGRGASFEKVSVEAPRGSDNLGSVAGGDAPTQGFALPPREIRQTVKVVRTGWSERDAMQKKLQLLLEHLESSLGTDYSKPPQGKALIFVKTRRGAEELGATVADYFGLDRCGVMHGLRRQEQREATLNAFREGKVHALVTTDVLGRGVDIPDVSDVVIFDFPDDIETYVHRVGRTGRNGRSGESVAFFEPRPWQPDIALELAEVLRSCGQEVPDELMSEVLRSQGGNHRHALWASSALPLEQIKRVAPPLQEKNNPDFASAEELGQWDAGGARVWSYSANGGVTEQGRFELRTGGLLRTTWGWGEWSLVDAPLQPAPAPADAGAGSGTLSGASDAQKRLSCPCLALSWGGITDVVALNADGISFGLVTRDGRPAHTFKKATLGRVLPDTVL